jgi:hypothetical protein
VAAPESWAGTGVTGGLVETGAASLVLVPVLVPVPVVVPVVPLPVVASPVVSGGGDPLSSDCPPTVLAGVELVEGAVDVDVGVVVAPWPVGIVPALDPGVEPVPELHAALTTTGATTAKSAGPANR